MLLAWQFRLCSLMTVFPAGKLSRSILRLLLQKLTRVDVLILATQNGCFIFLSWNTLFASVVLGIVKNARLQWSLLHIWDLHTRTNLSISLFYFCHVHLSLEWILSLHLRLTSFLALRHHANITVGVYLICLYFFCISRVDDWVLGWWVLNTHCRNYVFLSS